MSDTAAGRWALVTTTTATGTQAATQVVGRDEVRVPDCLRGYPAVLDVVRDWSTLEPLLRELDPHGGEPVDGQRLLIPVRYPNKVLCSGPNFTDHLAEMGESGLGDAWTGYFFFKPPTTSLVGPTDAVPVGGTWQADRVDWEGELAVVLAHGGRDIPREQALQLVAGYTVANDISLRGPHRRDTPAAPFVWDWVASKAADGSLPLGPGIVPAWQVPDPQDLSIRTWVNDDLRQDGSTATMVLGVDQLISDASRLLTLEPGDVILTGTPAGVGASRGTFLRPGDTVTVDIAGIGRLRNPIVQDKDRRT